MVRLRNVSSGAVVSVPDEKSDRLGSEWVPVEVEKPAARKAAAPAKKPSKS